VDAGWLDDGLGRKWDALRGLRGQVTEAIEPYRRDKVIRSSLEAEVTVPETPDADLEELFIVAKVSPGDGITVTRTDKQKCGRCWRHLPEVPEDGALCDRCAEVVGG
jgi:isoleucyl-tRNA synthetase